MGKIIIEYKIVTNGEKQEFKCNGLLDSDKKTIKFFDRDPLNTMILLDFKNNTILRDNKDINFLLTFDINKDKILNCKLKGSNKFFSILLKTKNIYNNNGIFKVDYDTFLDEEIISSIQLEIKYNQNNKNSI